GSNFSLLKALSKGTLSKVKPTRLLEVMVWDLHSLTLPLVCRLRSPSPISFLPLILGHYLEESRREGESGEPEEIDTEVSKADKPEGEMRLAMVSEADKPEGKERSRRKRRDGENAEPEEGEAAAMVIGDGELEERRRMRCQTVKCSS
ncbi:hypothetical protein Dimus_036597, partial [Dionaea muscipula]